MKPILLGWALSLLCAPSALPYSVLTHEAIIDSAWDASIRPALLQRYADATPDQLLEAHAYAYGGSIIQDMGYYPFGSKLFTNLLHYVRSGDFILFLIADSQNLNEYAFALGALAHYAADNDGHRLATNVSVPLLYPKLRTRFGKQVTYADDALSHTKTEFGFDVLQVAQGHYAPDSYHSFIGFQVARPVLERAFEDTYGLKLTDVFASVDLAIGSYRHAVSHTIPSMTRVAWQLKKADIVKDAPGTTRRKFLYNLSHSSYHKSWGREYQQPGPGARLLAFILDLLPPIGKFRTFRFEVPTPQVEKLFMASFNASLERYRGLLSAAKAGSLQTLRNENFDIGEPTKAGRYRLTDETYAELLEKLHGHYADIPPGMKLDILAFYADLNAPIATKADGQKWNKVVSELNELNAAPAAASLR